MSFTLNILTIDMIACEVFVFKLIAEDLVSKNFNITIEHFSYLPFLMLTVSKLEGLLRMDKLEDFPQKIFP